MIELDLAHRARLQADTRMDRALQPGVAADRVRLVVEVGQLQAVRLGGRAEVEDPRPPGPREQRVALALVERPVADLGRRDVADVARCRTGAGRRGRTPRALPCARARGGTVRSRSKSTRTSQSTPAMPGAGVVATGNPSVVIVIPLISSSSDARELEAGLGNDEVPGLGGHAPHRRPVHVQELAVPLHHPTGDQRRCRRCRCPSRRPPRSPGRSAASRSSDRCAA